MTAAVTAAFLRGPAWPPPSRMSAETGSTGGNAIAVHDKACCCHVLPGVADEVRHLAQFAFCAPHLVPVCGVTKPHRRRDGHAVPRGPLTYGSPGGSRDLGDIPGVRVTTGSEFAVVPHVESAERVQRPVDVLRVETRRLGDIPDRDRNAAFVEQADHRVKHRQIAVCQVSSTGPRGAERSARAYPMRLGHPACQAGHWHFTTRGDSAKRAISSPQRGAQRGSRQTGKRRITVTRTQH